ncbi:MAG: alpha-L-fucosidase [Acidobacteriota bacterium]
MNRQHRIMFLVSSVVAVLFGIGLPAAAGEIQPDPDLPGLGNRLERLEWLQDAGFGMFVHWSLDSQVGSVISHSLVGASEDYLRWFFHDLPRTFNPKRWDPEELAVLAKLAGMKYVVFTTKHHSGFCWWDTKTTDFKATNTPFGQDLLYGYVQALRKHGLGVGFYYSPEDFAWLHRNGFEIRRRNLVPHPDEDPHYVKHISTQVAELFTHYGPVDVLFIDGEGELPTKKTAWSLQPSCLITRGAIATPEQFVPGRPPRGPWESNLTMGTQWAYKPTNEEYKSGTRIIEILIETRAKGGSLLLNVGPKPNGELPIEQEERLREIALWQAVNGESIHDTRPWVVPREEDIWFSKSKDRNTVYAFLTRQPEWPRGQRREFLLRSVKATTKTRISVLGHNGRVVEYMPQLDGMPRFEQKAEALEISVVRGQRLYNNHRWPNPVVVKLENVEPAFTQPPYAETTGALLRGSQTVVFQGELIDLGGAGQVEVGIEYQVYGGFAVAMHNTEWTATAVKKMNAPGSFEVEVSGLKPETEYQYRAFVRHPKIVMRGDHKQVCLCKGSVKGITE